MPIDPVSKEPPQNFTKEEIPTAMYWIISSQHSISATKRLESPGLPSMEKSMQEEPFLDQLLEARSQWIANGHPNKPLPGVNTSKKTSKAWEVIILYITS